MTTLATAAAETIRAEKRAARIQSAVARRQHEIDELVAAHRLVRVTYPLHTQDEQQVIHCTAKFDMPAYGIVVGEQFDLVASSYPGYFYIVKDGVTGRECTCKSHEFRHTCDHATTINEIVKARLHAQQHVSQPATVALTERTEWQDDDTSAHVEDSLRKRCALNGNQGFSLTRV